eukprot:s2367_g7.t1
MDVAPLSSSSRGQAVLSSLGDDTSFMQTSFRANPVQHNEMEAPAWYPFPNDHADHANDEVDNSEEESFDVEEHNSDDPDDSEDPENDPPDPHPPPDDPMRQSCLL